MEQEVLMPKKLGAREILDYGVILDGRQMDNGEFRFSLKVGDVGYVWTESPKDRAEWQNAHYHLGLRETYIVERGRMALATQGVDGLPRIQMFDVGDIVTTVLGEQHNVYLFPNSGIHTVKHGTPIENSETGADWYPADPKFDTWTKSLSVEEIYAHVLQRR